MENHQSILWLMAEGASRWPEVQAKHKPDSGSGRKKIGPPGTEPTEGVPPRHRFPHGPWAVLGPWDLTAALSGLTGTTGETHGSLPCPEGLGTAPLPMGPVLQPRADGQGSSHLSTWISPPLRLV